MEAYGYEVFIYAIDGSYRWNLAAMGTIFRNGFVRGTSDRSLKTARWRARQAAKDEVEG